MALNPETQALLDQLAAQNVPQIHTLSVPAARQLIIGQARSLLLLLELLGEWPGPARHGELLGVRGDPGHRAEPVSRRVPAAGRRRRDRRPGRSGVFLAHPVLLQQVAPHRARFLLRARIPRLPKSREHLQERLPAYSARGHGEGRRLVIQGFCRQPAGHRREPVHRAPTTRGGGPAAARRKLDGAPAHRVDGPRADAEEHRAVRAGRAAWTPPPLGGEWENRWWPARLRQPRLPVGSRA
jgi:hypothetical protein